MKRPRSFIGKVIWVVRTRPAHLYGTLRGFLLFFITYYLRKVFTPQGVDFGSNVRLQRLKSIMAEAPLSKISIGSDSIIYENAKIEAYGGGNISIGEQSVLGDVKIISRVNIQIGKRFLSSWNVFFEDFDPHPVSPSLRALQVAHIASQFRPTFRKDGNRLENDGRWEKTDWKFSGEPIVVGDDVWVGANVTVLKGAKIGNGCIIASGAVVLKGVYEDGSVLAGNPAKVVKVIKDA